MNKTPQVNLTKPVKNISDFFTPKKKKFWLRIWPACHQRFNHEFHITEGECEGIFQRAEAEPYGLQQYNGSKHSIKSIKEWIKECHAMGISNPRSLPYRNACSLNGVVWAQKLPNMT